MIGIDRLREIDVPGFAAAHRKEILIVASVVLAVIVALLAVECGMSGSARRAAAKRAAVLAAQAIKPDELMYPSEPLAIPGIQRFREPHTVWTAEEAKKWYTAPDTRTLEALRSAGRKPVDELLESVP